MGDKSAIEWTEASWNPVMGCSRVSEGCRNCYAERQAIRIAAYRLNGVVKSTPAGPRWTGEIRLNPAMWTAPLHWRRPRRIFVNSMSDLFHEGISDAHLDELWGLMAKAYWHTFQVLTKRPERMLDYLTDHAGGGRHIWSAAKRLELPSWANWAREAPSAWPLQNVWLGVSVEDQATAEERIPLLLETPAAVRWVSYEPALAPANFDKWLSPCSYYCNHENENWPNGHRAERSRLDWIVIGGESGPRSRPFYLTWARETIAQCRSAGVPVFVKQLGSWPEYDDTDGFRHGIVLHDSKGGNPSEWPEDLAVREYPR